MVGVSDSFDVVEEADEEETDEWCQLEVYQEEGGSGVDERNSLGDDPSKLTGLVCSADGDAAELGHRGNVLSCENQ